MTIDATTAIVQNEPFLFVEADLQRLENGEKSFENVAMGIGSTKGS